jgi:hypothetical protein
MRAWLAGLVIGLALLFSTDAAAQGEIRLSKLYVQLWPEYDQPSMLVIYDFQVSPETSLPARVTFAIPAESNLIAVAAESNGGLVNAEFEGPVVERDGRSFTIIVREPIVYHFEYYQPLARNGDVREFDYFWPGAYAVDEFVIRVQQPLDTTTFSLDPPLLPVDTIDGLTYLGSQPMQLAAGTTYTLDVNYEKTSDALTDPADSVEPAAPLDEDTSGRISGRDYMPYVVLAVMILLIAGGLGYNYLSERIRRFNPRTDRSASAEGATSPGVHCHQCGQRAHSGDRFCRVCGTKLRNA